MDAVDPEVLDEDGAGEEADLQRADVQRALDVIRAGFLGARAHERAEIDRHRRDDRRGEHRHDQREREADVAERREIPNPLEDLH